MFVIVLIARRKSEKTSVYLIFQTANTVEVLGSGLKSGLLEQGLGIRTITGVLSERNGVDRKNPSERKCANKE